MGVSIQIIPDAGSNITDAFAEAIRISSILKCCVEFKFNNVTCFGYWDGNADVGAKEYHEAQASGRQYKFANSRR